MQSLEGWSLRSLSQVWAAGPSLLISFSNFLLSNPNLVSSSHLFSSDIPNVVGFTQGLYRASEYQVSDPLLDVNILHYQNPLGFGSNIPTAVHSNDSSAQPIPSQGFSSRSLKVNFSKNSNHIHVGMVKKPQFVKKSKRSKLSLVLGGDIKMDKVAVMVEKLLVSCVYG